MSKCVNRVLTSVTAGSRVSADVGERGVNVEAGELRHRGVIDRLADWGGKGTKLYENDCFF